MAVVGVRPGWAHTGQAEARESPTSPRLRIGSTAPAHTR